MLVVIAMGMGVILTLFLSMKRHSKRRDPAVDELIQEVTRLEKSLPEAEQTKALPPPPMGKTRRLVEAPALNPIVCSSLRGSAEPI